MRKPPRRLRRSTPTARAVWASAKVIATRPAHGGVLADFGAGRNEHVPLGFLDAAVLFVGNLPRDNQVIQDAIGVHRLQPFLRRYFAAMLTPHFFPIIRESGCLLVSA